VGPFKSNSKSLITQHGGRGWVCETDVARVRVGQGIAGQNYCVVLMVSFDVSLVYKCSDCGFT
jgi:hypothetical protein